MATDDRARSGAKLCNLAGKIEKIQIKTQRLFKKIHTKINIGSPGKD